MSRKLVASGTPILTVLMLLAVPGTVQANHTCEDGDNTISTMGEFGGYWASNPLPAGDHWLYHPTQVGMLYTFVGVSDSISPPMFFEVWQNSAWSPNGCIFGPGNNHCTSYALYAAAVCLEPEPGGHLLHIHADAPGKYIVLATPAGVGIPGVGPDCVADICPPHCEDLLQPPSCDEANAARQRLSDAANDTADEVRRDAETLAAATQALAYYQAYMTERIGDTWLDLARSECEKVFQPQFCATALPRAGGTFDSGRGTVNKLRDDAEALSQTALVLAYVWCYNALGGWEGCYTLFPFNTNDNPVHNLPHV